MLIFSIFLILMPIKWTPLPPSYGTTLSFVVIDKSVVNPLTIISPNFILISFFFKELLHKILTFIFTLQIDYSAPDNDNEGMYLLDGFLDLLKCHLIEQCIFSRNQKLKIPYWHVPPIIAPSLDPIML